MAMTLSARRQPLLDLGAGAVLLKGGHLQEGNRVINRYFDGVSNKNSSTPACHWTHMAPAARWLRPSPRSCAMA